MSIGILGKKLGMSQFFDESGRAVPVTLIEAGPCRDTQLKTSETEVLNRVAKLRASSSGRESSQGRSAIRRLILKKRDFCAAVVPILTSDLERIT